MNCCAFGVFCIINCYFECVYRIRCIFPYIGTYLKYIFLRFFELVWKDVPEVWTIFVRTIFLRFGGIFGVLNGPPPPPSPASMSKFPSGGNKYGNKCFFDDLLWFLLKQLKKWIIVLRWLRHVLKFCIFAPQHLFFLFERIWSKPCAREAASEAALAIASLCLKKVGTVHASFWMIFNVSWHRFLYRILVFAQNATQCRTPAANLQDTFKEDN